MKDKVLFFITSEFPYGKGETFLEDEIRYLSEAFEKIIIIPIDYTDSAKRAIPHNVLVRELSGNGQNWAKVFAKICNNFELLKEFSANAVSNPMRNKILLKSLKKSLAIFGHLVNLRKEFNYSKTFFYSYWLDDGAIAAAFFGEDSVKISRAHGWDVYFDRHKHQYLPLRNFLAEKLERIYTISENGKGYLDAVTSRPEKIRVSRLGTSNHDIFENKVEISGLNVVSISSLIPLKRVDLIGAAIKNCGDRNIKWNHFGDGLLEDEIKRDYPFGHFHGHLENSRIKEYLKSNSINSVVINTSSTEGIPVSMMEAMSFGIPCIGTNVGGVSEIIKDNVNGFLMPADPTAETIAEYIKRFFDLSPFDKNRLRANAFKTWDENYNADKNYRSFIAEIKALTLR